MSGARFNISNMLKKNCEKFLGDNNDLEWVGQYQ